MLTASIVVYKTAEMELKTIVNCALNSAVHKIYIVDNSPSNESQTVINSYHSPKLTYIYGHGNIGYGAGHNIAIEKSIELGATYHIILNPDIIFQADSISSCDGNSSFHHDSFKIRKFSLFLFNFFFFK